MPVNEIRMWTDSALESVEYLSADYRDFTFPPHVHDGFAIYDALLTINLPKDARFQVITEHEPADLILDPRYLGIERSADCLFIQITLNEGRSLAQKRGLYKAIADGLHQSVGMRREDVRINLVEVDKENWSYGNGEAQYAP